MASMHQDIADLMVKTATEMGEATADLARGVSTVEAWHEAMASRLQVLHQSAAGLAHGTMDLPDAERTAIQRRIESELQYLSKFANQVADGTQRVSWIDSETGERMVDGQFVNRAAMYANAGHATLEESNRRLQAENGAQWERRLLDDAENCQDCIEYAELGWQEIGTLPEIGDSSCASNCRCVFEYSGSDEQPED